MDRVILHCDCNSFFASVEMVFDPSLRQVPMAVCGDPESRHGIILAKNELAKAAGIVTAETVFSALRKCPSLRLVPPQYHAYKVFSKQVNAIYARYTDLIEPFGIDESWLDVTGSQKLFGSGREIADRLRREVKAETGLTISVGVSFNKVFAKLGSDYRKPDATTEITRENMQRIVYPLPVESLLYVGGSVQRQLSKMAIRTIGELANADPGVLHTLFGKTGEILVRYARGEDTDPVRHEADRREIKSVGNGMTFCRDLTAFADMHTAIYLLSDTIAARLRRYGLFCRTVHLSVKTPDLHTGSKQQSLAAPTAISREIADAAIALLHSMQREGAPVRLLTVTASALTPEENTAQLCLFEDGAQQQQHKRRQRLEYAVDGIRSKYGKEVLRLGSVLQNGFIPSSTDKNEALAEKIKKV